MASETNAGVYFIKAAIECAGTIYADMIITELEWGPLAWETSEGGK